MPFAVVQTCRGARRHLRNGCGNGEEGPADTVGKRASWALRMRHPSPPILTDDHPPSRSSASSGACCLVFPDGKQDKTMMHPWRPRRHWKDLARGHGTWMMGPWVWDPSKQVGRVAEAAAGPLCAQQLRPPTPGPCTPGGESASSRTCVPLCRADRLRCHWPTTHSCRHGSPGPSRGVTAPQSLLPGNWVLWAAGRDSEEGSPCPLLETKCFPRVQRPLRWHWPQGSQRGSARNPLRAVLCLPETEACFCFQVGA